MKIYLVAVHDYDVVEVDSAWATRAEAEARILDARTTPLGDPAYVPWSENFAVKEITLGEVYRDSDRYL